MQQAIVGQDTEQLQGEDEASPPVGRTADIVAHARVVVAISSTVPAARRTCMQQSQSVQTLRRCFTKATRPQHGQDARARIISPYTVKRGALTSPAPGLATMSC